MSDPKGRRSSAISRLRQQLKKKRESLADEFQYKIYIIFHFVDKNKNKKPAVYELGEVLPVMTNNFKDTILKGAKENAYTYESSTDLLDKDIVQLHALKWRPLRKDVIGRPVDIDFYLWPRKDIERVECMLFSRWKDQPDQPFRRLQTNFEILTSDYGEQVKELLTYQERRGLIITNNDGNVFLFVEKHFIKAAKNPVVAFKLSSMCLYIPQDQLMFWGSQTMENEMAPYLDVEILK